MRHFSSIFNGYIEQKQIIPNKNIFLPTDNLFFSAESEDSMKLVVH